MKLKAAILGTGNIGTDLLVKVLRSEKIECTLFTGRRTDSPGIARAKALGVHTSTDGVAYIEHFPAVCDLVFDATNAQDARRHAPILEKLGKIVIDLTPAQVGEMIVPVVNCHASIKHRNVNMVTCGGQTAIPIAHELGLVFGKNLDSIEVVSQISSRSAGPATRRNLDEYIHTTERGLTKFSGCAHTKTILNLNPAVPCVNMQATVMAQLKDFDATWPIQFHDFQKRVEDVAKQIRAYVPGYSIIVPPSIQGERIFTMVRVVGRGDFLPAYAGNLDIINCAAVATAERFADEAIIAARSA